MTKHTSNLAYESSANRAAELVSTGGHQVSPDLNDALAALLLEIEQAVGRLRELTKEADFTSWNQTKRKVDVIRELTAQHGHRGALASSGSSSYPTKAAIVRLIAAGRASGLDICGYGAGPDGFKPESFRVQRVLTPLLFMTASQAVAGSGDLAAQLEAVSPINVSEQTEGGNSSSVSDAA